mmetsp:Transcript_27657/g.73157  ORF Transcript_27657/g.73157 Transcript_27657/m.73157 type:complete len:124 (-) Transcript_27657:209-580(-)
MGSRFFLPCRLCAAHVKSVDNCLHSFLPHVFSFFGEQVISILAKNHIFVLYQHFRQGGFSRLQCHFDSLICRCIVKALSYFRPCCPVQIFRALEWVDPLRVLAASRDVSCFYHISSERAVSEV